MRNWFKKLFLHIPWIHSYVRSVRELRVKLIDKEKGCLELRELIQDSRSPGLFKKHEDFLTERLMAHPVKTPLPSLEFVSIEPDNRDSRVRVAERLLNAYHMAKKNEEHEAVQRDGEDIWSSLLNSELAELIEVLEKRDAKQLAIYLTDFGKVYTWFGGISTSIDGYNRNLDTAHIALTYWDKLLCLAESLGILNIENPESGPWGDVLSNDVNELTAKIAEELGIDIAPPQGIIHTDGIMTNRGVFHYRHINSLYMATRIKNLLEPNTSIAEIGGGLGITAMYAKRLGCSDYTMYDLPLTCLLAGHYLIHALGENNVSLYGEERNSNSICILPYWEFFKAESKSVGIMVNQDSIPEMTENFVAQYLENIERVTKNYFLSMNHETFSGKTVNEYTKKYKSMCRIYRFKSWTREGYIEECYKIQT